MSFFDNLAKAASQLLGDANPQDVAQAASDHTASLDPSELAGHLQQSLGTMDQSSLTGLGQQLLQTFTNHGAYSGDGAQAAEAAGTSADAVASGSPEGISALIDYAKSNPQILQTAVSAFMQRNPQALEQLAPGLLSGIMGRLGINPSAAPSQ
jgi:hypothetical protein